MDVKCKLFFLLLSISFQSVISQNGLNVGFLYRPRHDATFSRQSGNVDVEYTAKREDVGLVVGYDVWEGLNMATSLGVSFYNIGTNLYVLPDLSRSTHQGLSNVDLFVSQDIRYDLVRIAKRSKIVNLNIGPAVNLTYYQNLNKRKQLKGFSDLNDQSANDFIIREKLPVSNTSFNSHSGYLSASGGLYLNLIFFNRVGLDYSIGYSANLIGNTDINVKYRFDTGSTQQAEKFTTKEKGIIQSFSIRYYFK
ncbi:MAG: hypothetical protein ACRC9Q_05920 [Bacteroidales bacterium]